MLVGLGIPDGVVDTVGNTVEVRFVLLQHPLQTAPKLLGRTDLFRVLLADGCDHVGIDKSGFHEIEFPVEFDAFLCKFGFRQSRFLE